MPFAGLDLTRVNGPGDLLWNRRDGGSTLRRAGDTFYPPLLVEEDEQNKGVATNFHLKKENEEVKRLFINWFH